MASRLEDRFRRTSGEIGVDCGGVRRRIRAGQRVNSQTFNGVRFDSFFLDETPTMADIARRSHYSEQHRASPINSTIPRHRGQRAKHARRPCCIPLVEP